MIAMIEKFPPAMRRAFDACRTHFYAAAGFSALINLLYLAPTIYMMQVYDRVVPTGGVMTLVWITVVLGLALGTLSALDNVRSRIMALASLKLNDELAGNILGELVSRRKTELTGQAMREFDSLRQTMTGPAMMALFDAPWTPIYFIAAFLIHPYLGLMILCGGVILVTLAVLNERQSRERARTAMRANAQTYAAQEALASKAELIAALGLRKAMVARQQGARSAGLKASNEAQSAGMRYSSLIKFTRMFMQSLALGLGAVLAINGLISSGTIIAASVLLSRALQPIEQLVGGWAQIIAARRSIDILSEILKDADATAKDYHPLPEPAGKVSLAGVSVRGTSEENPILRGISLQIEPGEIVGVIGHSGAGKSTMARIIAGALAPDTGDVRIDHASYGDWDPDELARHIGYMPQESVLLPGTIAENLSCFANLRGENQDAVATMVLEAAQQAGVHEMILRIPNGYAARIDDPAFGLSGGQIQRLALARAIYGAPKLLVLDEPNSALDGEGERALLWAVRNAKARGAAVILVAHQAQIVSSADRLVMMRNGGIEYQGPTQKVIEALREEAARNNVKAMNREAATNV